MRAIGIDIGGTFIKYGLIQGNRILVQKSIPTPFLSHPKILQETVEKIVWPLLVQDKRKIRGIGIGIPGLVRFPQGVVRSVVNLKGNWREVPLKAILERRLHLPIWIDNDVNCMTLAEWKCGAGKRVKNLVCLTLGTGVGGGLILEGNLYRGLNGSAGEIGHIPLKENGPHCPCGGRGCLERYVGNRDILRWVKRRLRGGTPSRMMQLVQRDLSRLSPEIIDKACALEDPLALQTWKRVGVALGIVLAGVVNLLSPERIVIGGGISKAGKWLFEPLRQTIRCRSMKGLGNLPVVPASLGSSAGILGAALLVREG